MYPTEITLNKANNKNPKCPFLHFDVYISQGECKGVCRDGSESSLCITDKLLSQGFCYHKLIKTFSKFRFGIKI